MIKEIVIKTGVVAELNGKYYGIQYEDGHSRSYDFGPIEKAVIADPKYCSKPTSMTYSTSPDIKKLEMAKLVNIKVVTTYEIVSEEN